MGNRRVGQWSNGVLVKKSILRLSISEQMGRWVCNCRISKWPVLFLFPLQIGYKAATLKYFFYVGIKRGKGGMLVIT